MSNPTLRALVVDDEAIARRMVMMALSEEGFVCEPAVDGVDALRRIADTDFDLVVTDLRMPNMHGHDLSVELLARSPAPVVAVHSSVDNPRLTKDLILRGVDDIIHKPANYPAFAAKMRALVRRRNQQLGGSPRVRAENKRHMLDLAEFDQRLNHVSQLIPVSEISVELVELIQTGDVDSRKVERLIARDAALTAELLRLANSSFCNSSQRRIVDLHDAVVRVGIRRIGEMALAVGALANLAQAVMPWFDRELARKRSQAACLIANRLLQGQQSVSQNPVVLSALLYPLARTVLGTAFSGIYETLISESREQSLPLKVLEASVFPRSAAAAMSEVLARTGLPLDILAPLSHADAPYEALTRLSERLRVQVKLLKTSVALGELAVGRWLPWDEICIPPRSLLDELGVVSAKQIIYDVRQELITIERGENRTEATSIRPSSTRGRPVAYADLSAAGCELMPLLLESMGYELHEVSDSLSSWESEILVNALNASESRLHALQLDTIDRSKWMLLGQAPLADIEGLQSLTFPNCFHAVQAACEKISREPFPEVCAR